MPICDDGGVFSRIGLGPKALAWPMVLAAALVPIVPAAAGTPARTVDIVQVAGIIDPPEAGYLRTQISAARSAGSEAVIVQLDTPGALGVSVRALVSEVLHSQVPVGVWVAPRGARAASA